MAINAENEQLKKAVSSAQQNAQTNAAPAPTQQRTSSYSSGPQSTGTASGGVGTGSGRFTNLKSYVDANQGAGQQLGSKITGTIDKNLEKTEKKATTQTGQIRDAIQGEKDRLAEGNTFNEQLKTQQAVDIYGNQPTRDRFGNLLNNQNVASNLMQQSQQARDESNTGFNQVDQQIGNLGTEQGRFALLQQSVKKPGYTTGQQRLDQLFLQAGDPNSLVQSQRDLSGRLNASKTGLENTYGELGTGISEADQQARQVAEMLKGTLSSETDSLVDAQRKQAEELNKQYGNTNRVIEQFFTSGYNTLTNPEDKALIDQMLASGGLNAGMRTYNVLKDGHSNYVTQGRTDLGAADAVDANELARYQALFGLAGNDPSKGQFTQVGDLGPQAGIKGEQLLGDITNARSALEQQLNRREDAHTYIYDKPRDNVYANFLDLLKYQEGQNFGNFNGGAAHLTGDIVPIYGNNSVNGRAITTYGNSKNDPKYNYLGSAKDQYVVPELDKLVMVNDSSAGTRDASGNFTTSPQELLKRYLAEIDAAGYYNTLGGTKPK